MIEAQGHNGQVQFDGVFITIIRSGFLARATVGKGEKRIPLVQVNAVQWKAPGALVNGYIQFETSGGGGTRARFGHQTVQAGRDENSVIMTKKQAPAFEQLRSAIEQAIANRHTGLGQAPAAAPAPSAADELAKLAALMQQGLLTPTEFQQAKARLLAG
ncbi:DUF4429 domain-containing protein [Actinoplanes sp. NBC_00393]|uniref:DUF4429 domain-containing protein n=1 Tax=Actinoplanes sp. NBC_00393 TaxID=2975953 RepID=UPI002E206A00